ncbi:MAG: hypothetical protein OEY89_15240, partial [Gammaproteobacteria bacterium]|nr:hypothetical protein [Gammaproteobacteria bacterium]
MSNEEKITDLIDALFNWIEKENSSLLSYGKVNFRGALERFFYFSSVNRLEALRPLLNAARAWRDSTNDELLAAYYDLCLAEIGEESLLSLCVKFLRKIAWLVKLRIAALRSSTLLMFHENPPDSGVYPIAFFAFNNRFVYFFKEVVRGLGAENCVFISTNGLVAKDVVSGIGARLITPSRITVEWSDVNIGVRHPLFFSYLMALFKYGMHYTALVKQRPSVLLFAEGTSMEDEIVALAAKNLGVPTVRLQSGRAGILHSGYRQMCFDKMLCWGHGFVERFKKYSPDPEYVITGSPLMDHARLGGSVSRANSSHTISIFTQPVSSYISENDYGQLVELAGELIRKDVRINLVIRKHPADMLDVFDALQDKFPLRIKMSNPETQSLAEVLHSSVGAVGFFSTTLSEATAYGVIPIILKLRDQHSVFPYPEKH